MTSPEMDSPFTPGVPVDPRLFVGREEQLQQLLDKVEQARQGNFQIAYVSGERGIGKSSLVKAALHLAETRHNAVVAHAHLGGISDFAGLGRRAMEATVRDGETRPWGMKLLDTLGDRVVRVNFLGVGISLKGEKREWEHIGQNLPTQMAALVKKIGDKRAPMVLALDDINGFADKPEFADWVKSATETAANRSGKIPVFLIFVGLEERRLQMIKHNPSVARVFQPTLHVNLWPKDETCDFFLRRFKEGGVFSSDENNSIKVTTNVSYCANRSGGFPMLAQEIGHAIWVLKRKGEADARKGEANVFIRGVVAAADTIGRQYLQSSVVDALHSDEYRAILAKAANFVVEHRDYRFTRRDLIDKAGLSEKEKNGLDRFFTRMKKLGAIVPDKESGERGSYRFPTRLHVLYFHMATRDIASTTKKSARAK